MVTIIPLRGQLLSEAARQIDGYACGEEPSGWVVSEAGEQKGYLLFSLPDVCITRMICDNPMLADGLLKTAADFAYHAGAEELVCSDQNPKNHQALKAAGFRLDGELWKIDPDQVLRGCGTE